jgi:lipoate synthase
VVRWWTPDEFDALGAYAEGLGFTHVESGPLVRSSYHAKRAAAPSPTGVTNRPYRSVVDASSVG